VGWAWTYGSPVGRFRVKSESPAVAGLRIFVL
jgi:hypothetical protein